MILDRDDAIYAANVFIDFFDDMNSIEDYMRSVKLERMSTFPTALPGFGLKDDFFDDFTMHPKDMDFEIKEMSLDIWSNYLDITSSHVNENSIPGRKLIWTVYEKNTNKIVGFIRFGSPVINSKPRNDFLGKPLDTYNPDVMKRFNDSTMMGFVIVPTQPFGFNYLGGKLLASMCCSHFARRSLNDKYNGTYCMFETTSLYGSSKSSSQYDGMKPFLRFKGLTQSDFAPMINDARYRHLNDFFKEKNDNKELVKKDANSRKLKTHRIMTSVIKKSLKEIEPKLYDKFCKMYSDTKQLTEKKRFYISDYGYENVKEYLNLETDKLKKKDNFDRYELENVIDWWKNKASTRYENLKNDNRLRNELEVWNENDNIDIIR